MYTQKVTIINRLGLHARPASEFVKVAQPFNSDIKLTCNGRTGVAKSIISIMALNVAYGDVLEICAEGLDEKEAVEVLVHFIKEGCGE